MKTSSTSARASRVMGRTATARIACGALAAAALAATVTTVQAHHSYSIYDSSKTRVFTGRVIQVTPDVNHQQISFLVMNDERKGWILDANKNPVVWVVEMEGSALAAKAGISVTAFPPKTVFSVALHPVRSGGPAGSRVIAGALYKCPANTKPAAGKHCDSVQGSAKIGNGELPTPTK